VSPIRLHRQSFWPLVCASYVLSSAARQELSVNKAPVEAFFETFSGLCMGY
jgi:hypothetical protein